MLANSTAAAKKTDQPGIWEIQKSYLLIPENSKTFLILSQPKMCQKYTFLLTRAHFLGATGAPTEPVHESLLKTPILSRPNHWSIIALMSQHESRPGSVSGECQRLTISFNSGFRPKLFGLFAHIVHRCLTLHS